MSEPHDKFRAFATPIIEHWAKGLGEHPHPEFSWADFSEQMVEALSLYWQQENEGDLADMFSKKAHRRAMDARKFVQKGEGREIVIELAKAAASKYQPA